MTCSYSDFKIIVWFKINCVNVKIKKVQKSEVNEKNDMKQGKINRNMKVKLNPGLQRGKLLHLSWRGHSIIIWLRTTVLDLDVPTVSPAASHWAANCSSVSWRSWLMKPTQPHHAQENKAEILKLLKWRSTNTWLDTCWWKLWTEGAGSPPGTGPPYSRHSDQVLSAFVWDHYHPKGYWGMQLFQVHTTHTDCLGKLLCILTSMRG